MRRNAGISPVIATIIIVAVAIAIAIAVAYWVVGIAGIFTRFEKLEISAAWATGSGTTGEVHLRVKNTGSAVATITDIMVNGVPLSDVTSVDVTEISNTGSTDNSFTDGSLTVDPGDEFELTIEGSDYDSTNGWLSGVTYEITLHTATGKDYPKAVAIP